MTRVPVRAVGVAAALFYILLWASAYVPSKIGVLGSSPLWFLVIRFALSGLLALGIARALGAAVSLALTYEALRHLASGIGAIVASTNPLVLALAAPWLLAEPLTRG